MDKVRIVVIDISDVLGSEVYDEAIFPIEHKDEINEFIAKYIDISKYRVITVWLKNKIHWNYWGGNVKKI